MHSSEASARVRRAPLGVESAGLPATVKSARIRPSPGVSISSAMQAEGSSPKASGSPRTRLFQRPRRTPLPRPGAPWVFAGPTAERANIAPPGRSRFPVSTFRTSTSQLAMLPNSWVQVPMRP